MPPGGVGVVQIRDCGALQRRESYIDRAEQFAKIDQLLIMACRNRHHLDLCVVQFHQLLIGQLDALFVDEVIEQRNQALPRREREPGRKCVQPGRCESLWVCRRL